MARVEVEGISVGVTPLGGMLEGLVIERDGRRIAPLHRAPWVGRPGEVPPDAAPHLAVLEGDFFCAPFGRTDEEGVAAHGWPANGTWAEVGRGTAPDGAVTARFELAEKVRGASVVKELTLRPGQPVVYQRHLLTGGEGAIPIAHHAMIRVPGGARLSFSPKDFGATPATPQESDPARGRSILGHPQRFASLAAVALADGTTRDLRRYPWEEGHEDFLSLFDPPDARIGWSAAVATADGFVFFAVKDAQLLPQTSLWMSNARPLLPALVLAPHRGARHRGELHPLRRRPPRLGGAERAHPRRLPHRGRARRRGGRALRARRHPGARGWSEIADIGLGTGEITIRDRGGDARTLPFDTGFFRGIAAAS